MNGSDRRGERQVVHHLMRIGPLVPSTVCGIFTAVVYLAAATCTRLAGVPGLDWSYAALALVVGGAQGLVGVMLFNAVAPRFGGVPLTLSEQPDPIAAALEGPRLPDPLAVPEGSRERKICPVCDAEVRLDRSFCPECDHTFDGSES
jgi:hypothetical protein